MRVLIVDDEPLARVALANLLTSRKDVEHFDTASDALEAFEKLRRNKYDVILLDIQMPELSGIGLIDRCKARNQPIPGIIFVTAHNEYAITAFEKHAVDYILKPFSSERVHEALDIAMRRTAYERAASLMEIMPQLTGLVERSSKIAMKVGGRILFVNPNEVFSAEAQGNYVLLQRQSGSYLLRASISTLLEKLRHYGFIRIHRSVLVNVAYVQDIKPCASGEYLLRIKGGKEYTVSRTFKGSLRSIAATWVGTETISPEL
jgi:two-component system LytT family response regulator